MSHFGTRVIKLRGDGVDKSAVESKYRKVDAVLALDPLSIDYRVSLRPDEALNFAKRCENNNAATNKNLTKLVQSVNAAVPPMWFGGDNPNNGNPHHEFLVGNEGSRVVYVRLRTTYLAQRIADDYKAACDNPATEVTVALPLREYVAQFWMPAFIGRLKSAGKWAEADEIHDLSKGDDEILIRFWYD